MTPLKFSALFFALFLVAQTSAIAQNADYRSTISTQAALNGWQIIALADNAIEADSVVGAYASATGTYGLSYDYAFVKWFSLGGQLTWNQGKVGAEQLSVTVEDKSYTGVAELGLRRVNVGIRPMFHYFNNGRFDWYSGAKIGLNYLKIGVNAGTEDLVDNAILDRLLGNTWLLNRNYRSVRPTVQLVALGMRGYVTENIGIGFEAAVGPTYYLSAQVNYRF